MLSPKKSDALVLLVFHEPTRLRLFELLQGNGYSPREAGDLGAVLQAIKGQEWATVIMDCEAVTRYGVGIFSKIKVACRHCRVILICDKAHKSHREIIREAMEIGIYACLLAPYEDWEVLAMVRYYPRKEGSKKAKNV
jgi:DNA-binding NtrC family response regulator